MRRPRVVVVDDHELFRDGVRARIGDDVEIAAEAGTVEEAIELIRAERPHVVLLDVHMPDGGGLAILRAVGSELPEVRFLVLSVSDAPADVMDLVRAGAHGYVTKAIDPADLAGAVRSVAAGEAVFSPSLAGFVLEDPELSSLTLREREGAPADRARLSVQGGRRGARHLAEDRGAPRIGRPAEAPAHQPPPAQPLGHQAPAHRLTPPGRRAAPVRGGDGPAPFGWGRRLEPQRLSAFLRVRRSAAQQAAESARAAVRGARRAADLLAPQLEQRHDLRRRLERVRDRAAGAERERREHSRVGLRDQRGASRRAPAVERGESNQVRTIGRN